jgi:hypothetical protein
MKVESLAHYLSNHTIPVIQVGSETIYEYLEIGKTTVYDSFNRCVE